MIGAWVVYCLLIAGLLGVAALAAEGALRSRRWPGRWVWAGAMAGSVGLPLAAWLAPAAAPAPGPLPGPGAFVMESLSIVAVAGGGPTVAELLLTGWAVLSALLLLYVTGAAVRLRSERGRWRSQEVEGVPVLVSRRTGPAAMGLMRSRIVVPEWVLGLDERLRRLLVLHESEHLRARDPQLAWAGLLVCVLMPWNLPLWWQLHRLRLALEIDCDARVLRRAPDIGAYGALLLEVGHRRSRLAVGLAESESMLERRIRMITRTEAGRRTLQALGLAAVAGVALAVACETPGPAELPEPRETVSEPSTAEAGTGAAPTFTPMTAAPRLRNADEIRGAILSHYPPLLREAGIGGVVNLWFFLDREGQVAQRRIRKSSGHPALDSAALRVADMMEFTPAFNRDERVPVWIALDVKFETRTADADDPAAAEMRRRAVAAQQAAERAQARAQARAAAREGTGVAEAPVFTPFTTAPALRNAEEVRAALDSQYPPLLRNAGVTGTATVWFFIDEAGVVQKVMIKESSGHEALDQAALRVAETMEFTPAHNRDERVPVWVALDVKFEVQK